MESIAMTAVGMVVNNIFDKFAKSAWSQVDMFIESNENLKKLERNFIRIVAFTDKIENGRQVFSSETIRKAWQRFSQDLKEVCYQIEDLLDDILLEISRQQRTLKLKELPKGKFALKRLEISKCDILKQRCIKGGEDWPIVRNIEKVVIDERDIK